MSPCVFRNWTNFVRRSKISDPKTPIERLPIACFHAAAQACLNEGLEGAIVIGFRGNKVSVGQFAYCDVDVNEGLVQDIAQRIEMRLEQEPLDLEKESDIPVHNGSSNK